MGLGITYGFSKLLSGASNIVPALVYASDRINKALTGQPLLSDEEKNYLIDSTTEAARLGLNADYQGSDKAMTAVGGLIEFAPAAIAAESTGGASFYLNGVGNAYKEVQQLKKEGATFDNGAEDLYIQGKGITDYFLMTKLNAHSLFPTLPSGLRNVASREASIDAIKTLTKSGEPLTSESLVAAFKDSAVKMSDNIKNKGVPFLKDLAKGYAKTSGDLTALTLSDALLKKASNKLAGEENFQIPDGSVGENIANIITVDAPLFAAVGARNNLGVMFDKSPFKNEVVEAVKADPSPQNIERIKQDVQQLAGEREWTPDDVQGTIAGIDKVASAVKKIPQTLSPEKYDNAFDIVMGKENLQEQLARTKEQNSSLDPALAEVGTPEERTLTAKLEQSDDKLREIVTNKKVKFSQDPETGEYFKQLGVDGKKEPITKDRFELEEAEQEARDIAENRNNIDELNGYVEQADQLHEQHTKQAERETDPAEKADLEQVANQSKKLSDDAKKELQDQIDQSVLRFQERFPEQDVDVMEDMPSSVGKTFESVEADKVADLKDVTAASDYLYDKYKKLTAMKEANSRKLTIDQINKIQSQIEEDITLLENYKEKYYGDNPAPKPVANDSYEPPKISGYISSFDKSRSKIQPAFKEGSTIYELENTQGNEYNLYPSSDKVSLKTMLNNRNDTIRKLFEEGNAYNPDAKKLIVTEPAKITHEGDKITIIKKGKIFYDKVESADAPNVSSQENSSASQSVESKNAKPRYTIKGESVTPKEEIAVPVETAPKPETNEVKQPIPPQENVAKESLPQERVQEAVEQPTVVEPKSETKKVPKKTEPIPDPEVAPEKGTTLRNADVAKKRADYGFDERVPIEKQSNPETEAKADAAIAKGYDVKDLIDRIKQGDPITAEESVILAKYQGSLQDKIIEINTRAEESIDVTVGAFERLVEERDKVLDDLLASYDASEMAGTVAGRALQARKIRVMEDYSLANMFIRKRKALNNQEMTAAQKQEVVNVYTKMKEAEDAFNAKIAKLKEENAALQTSLATEKMRREVNAAKRRDKRSVTKDTIRKERDQILADMKAVVRKSLGNVSANPVPVEMIPLIGKLAKNYFMDGITSVDQIVDNIHEQVKDLIEGVSKRDIRDAISGYGRDTRATKDDLRADMMELKTQARLMSQIEDAEAGLKKARTPEKEREANEEIEKLRAILKDLTKSDDALSMMKTRVAKQIKETQRKLAAGDYSKKEKTEYELDDEARKLQLAYRKIKHDFDVAVQKDILANRTKIQKFKDMAIDVGNIPRSLMATADLSAPLRQAATVTVSHPIIASKAFRESLRQWLSPEKADTWLADLVESDGYVLMRESKLYIADKTNAKVAAREEEFMSNLAEKIPVAGFLVAASERAYTGYLNKMRVDLFTRGVDVLENQGYTFAQNPDAYKSLAKYINAATGRGELPSILNTSAPVLNAAFFSPRLMASRLQLLSNLANPSWYKNTPKEVRNMYFSDMGKFVGFGIAVLALAAANGADVETDPRSPDFGKIRVGDTRWDIWAGFQQYVRFFAQEITGQKKSTASGKITDLDGKNYSKETRGTLVTNFVRGKLAPVPSLVTNALTGSDQIGQPFALSTEIPKMLIPLVIQGVYDSVKADGWGMGLGAVGVPSIFGVGVQTYGVNNFMQKGVDDKSIQLLKEKKAVAIEPKEADKKIYDIKTGEERSMTSSEFKKYYDTWSGYIKEDLKVKGDLYKDMSPGQFEDIFRSIKIKASKAAKEEVAGVSDADRTIEYQDTKYELTNDQIKERIAFAKEYIQENGAELEAKLREGNEDAKDLPKEKKAKAILTDTEIKAKIRSIASRYSKAQMLEKYINDDNEVTLTKKE